MFKLKKMFSSKLDNIVFVELKKEIKVKDIVLDKNIPLPILFADMMDKVKGVSDEDIHTESLLKGMAYIIALDDEFKYNEYYKKILLKIENIGFHLLKIGLNCANKNEKIDAMIFLKAGLLFDKDNLDMLINYGRCAIELSYEENEYSAFLLDESKNVFEYLKMKYPENPYAYYQLGFIYSNENNYILAEEMWVTAIKLNIDENKKHEIVTNLHDLNAKISFEKGHTLILNGRVEEGLEILLSLEEEYVDWWNLMFFIGLGYRMSKEYDLALKYFVKVINLNTGHKETYNEMGLCYMTMGRYDDAINVFKEALKIHRNSSELLCNLAIVYMQMGDLNLSEKYLMDSLRENPEDEISLAWLERLKTLKKS